MTDYSPTQREARFSFLLGSVDHVFEPGRLARIISSLSCTGVPHSVPQTDPGKLGTRNVSEYGGLLSTPSENKQLE